MISQRQVIVEQQPLLRRCFGEAGRPRTLGIVLLQASCGVGGPAAAIFSKSPIAGTGSVYYESGIDPYYRELYFEKYVKLDPATTGHYFANIGQPIATADLMPYDEFLETQFYREWARLSARNRAGDPHGLRSIQVSMNKGISISRRFFR